jgi:hypothetical protein
MGLRYKKYCDHCHLGYYSADPPEVERWCRQEPPHDPLAARAAPVLGLAAVYSRPQ